LHGAQGSGRSGGEAADKKMGQGDIHPLAPLKVSRVLRRARMGFHQHAGQAHLSAVAMGETRVAVRAISERLDMVALGGEALHRLLLQVQLGLPQRGVTRAMDFQAVGIVIIAAVPVVRIHHQSRAQSRQQGGHGARFRLGERPPVAVQVGMGSVFARAQSRAVRVDHGDDIQSDMPQVGLDRGVFVGGDFVDQPQKRFRGGRLIPMLAAQNQQAHGLGGRHSGVAQPHQPQGTFVDGLPRRSKADPGRPGRIGTQGRSHLAIRRDRGRGGLHGECADKTQQQGKQRRNRAHG
jgi:hypothetical protein